MDRSREMHISRSKVKRSRRTGCVKKEFAKMKLAGLTPEQEIQRLTQEVESLKAQLMMPRAYMRTQVQRREPLKGSSECQYMTPQMIKGKLWRAWHEIQPQSTADSMFTRKKSVWTKGNPLGGLEQFSVGDRVKLVGTKASFGEVIKVEEGSWYTVQFPDGAQLRTKGKFLQPPGGRGLLYCVGDRVKMPGSSRALGVVTVADEDGWYIVTFADGAKLRVRERYLEIPDASLLNCIRMGDNVKMVGSSKAVGIVTKLGADDYCTVTFADGAKLRVKQKFLEVVNIPQKKPDDEPEENTDDEPKPKTSRPATPLE